VNGSIRSRYRWLSCAVCLTLAALLFAPMLNRAARGAELPAEARDVLDRFVGKWDTEATIRRPGPPPEEKHTVGRGLCTVTLEGRYYEFRTSTVPPADSELQVMTYDPETKLFKQWVFASDGYTHAADGTWDAATNTLRWTGKTGANSFVIDDKFVAPDRLEWMLTRTDAAGQTVQTISGALKRVAE
jgi:hypothetical protein